MSALAAMQLDFSSSPYRRTNHDGGMYAKWLAFHRANPEVYRQLVNMARQVKAQGHNHYSIATLFEVLRWESDITTVGSTFKLNNNHKPQYARLIMDQEPDLAEFFELRIQTSAR